MENLYNELIKIYGDVGKWWPGTPEEIFVTAILTQNTNWKNVEKALKNIYKLTNPHDILKDLHKLSKEEIAKLIKPAGFFNIKADRLKNLLNFLAHYNFEVEKLKKYETYDLRKELLNIKGIGKETADSILLYALNKPILVVDTYTKRILERMYGIKENDYEKVQSIFHESYPRKTKLFQQLHGLIVEHAKAVCRKKPLCNQCKLSQKCFFKSS
ncbi:endonuclease III domain-containing protein [Thermosipho atlanticus]|uniref:endonuclease III domain-containing protein n=1 Tax=Thermosipho atlanticus TaxID=238991 RepID=UPI000A05E88D